MTVSVEQQRLALQALQPLRWFGLFLPFDAVAQQTIANN